MHKAAHLPSIHNITDRTNVSCITDVVMLTERKILIKKNNCMTCIIQEDQGVTLMYFFAHKKRKKSKNLPIATVFSNIPQRMQTP